MAVAAVAEQRIEQQIAGGKEVYAESLRNFRIMGHLACQGLVETPEYQGARAERWTDFYTAIAENLATDPDYGEQLYFSPMISRPIVDGHVVDKTGKPIYEVAEDGLKASTEEAEEEPEMLVQAERDTGDVEVMTIVDNLKVGELYAVASIEPKKELKRNPKFWKNKMKYRDGMAVLQVFYKTSETELLTGNYAVKRSDLAAFREIFRRREVEIPEDESSNRYSRYGILQSMTMEEALSFGPKLVKEHRELIHDSIQMVSATEIVYENISLLEKYFNAYLVPLSVALVSKDNDPALQSFADTILQKGINFSPELRKKLMKISNSSRFGEDDARLIEEKVRYAVIEELRKLIPGKLAKPKHEYAPIILDVPLVPVARNYSIFEVQAINQQAARNIADGIKAKRSYGGCSGSGEDDPNDPLSGLPNSQLALRGVDREKKDDPEDKTNWKWKKGVCRIEKCSTRPGETEIGPCDVCHGCQKWFDKGLTLEKINKIYGGLKSATSSTVKSGENHKQTIFSIDKEKRTRQPKSEGGETKPHTKTLIKAKRP